MSLMKYSISLNMNYYLRRGYDWVSQMGHPDIDHGERKARWKLDYGFDGIISVKIRKVKRDQVNRAAVIHSYKRTKADCCRAREAFNDRNAEIADS
jgi:hypothetical protein